MKSKTSLFNTTIFNKNIKRVWPFWGLLSFAAVIPSLVMLMEWIKHDLYVEENSTLYIKEAYYTAASYVAPFVAFATAIVVAMFVWDYLYSAKSVGAFHSFPVNRTGLFVTSYISGIVIMLIPYVIGGGLIILTFLITGYGFSSSVFVLIAAVILDSIFFFSLATVIAMMTGHILALPVLYLVFNFLALLMENLVALVFSNFLYGFDFDLSDRAGFLSPLYYMLVNVNVNRSYDYEYGENFYYRDMTGVTLENYHVILIYGAVGVVLAVIALLMYKKRKSESAGDVISSKILKPIILFIYTAVGTIILGMLLYYIFSEGNIQGMNVILGSICFIAALAIAFYTGLMLLEKSVRVFTKKTFRSFIVGAVIVVVACFGIRYDFFGIETRVPDVSKIKEVTVYAQNHIVIDGDDKELLQKVTDIHKAIVDNKDLMKERFYGQSDEEYSFGMASFDYYLTNGETISREYRIAIPRNNQTDFDKAFINFISDKDIVRTLTHENDNYYISGGFYSIYSYDYELNASYDLRTDSNDFDEEQAKKIYDAVLKDLEEGNWRPGVSEFINDFDIAVGYIDIAFEEKTVRSENTYYFNTDDLNVNVTTKMTHTIKALAEVMDVPYEKLSDLFNEIERRNLQSYVIY